MKKIMLLMFLCVLGLTFLLCGCVREVSTDSLTTAQPTTELQINNTTALPIRIETPYYILESSNGETYLSLTNESEIKNPSDSDGWGSGLIAAPVLKFSSLDEMRQKFFMGNFNESELQELNRFSRDPVTNTIKLCDLNALVTPKLSDQTIVKILLENGPKLTFCITDQDKNSFYFFISSKEECEKKIQEQLDFLFDNETVTVTKHQKIEDRNAEEAFYTTKFVEGKRLWYSFEKDGTVYTVFESYLLYHEYFPEYVSAERPMGTYVFLENENGLYGYYYYSHRENNRSQFTIDEISSIGIELYTNDKSIVTE